MITRRDGIFLLFFGFCAVIFFSPVLFTGHSFFLRDITFLFHPWKTFSSEMIARGEMPLWDPYAYCGMPFLANWQSAVLYPFSLFFYVFPFAPAMKLYHVTHFFLAGSFAWLFARKLGLPRHAAAAVMLIAALNGYMVTRLEFLSHFGADAWFFCLLLAARSPLFLGGAFSLCLLAGHPVSFFQALVVLAYAIFSSQQELPPARRYGLPAAAGFICAAGIAAAQLLPTFELSGMASRVRTGIDAAVAMTYSLSIRNLAGIVSPYFVPRSPFAVTGEKFFWGAACWIGITGTLCAAAGMAFNRKSRLILFWGISGSFAVILALGSSTPVYPWLFRHLPFLGSVRYPSQFMLIAVNSFAMIAGYGISKIKPRYGLAVTVLIAGELLFTASGFQITAPDGYFHQKPAIASAMQAAGYHSRFLLSPGTEKDRRMRGSTVPGAWQAARGYLYNLVSLPCHIENAYGFGEPLSPSGIDAAVDAAYRQSTVDNFLPYITRLGVTHLITRSRSGYGILQPEYGGPPFLFRIPGANRFSASTPDASVVQVAAGSHRTIVKTRSSEPFYLEWKDTFFPGWEAYGNGVPLSYAHADTPFRVIKVPEGEQRIVQLYRPGAWEKGLLISFFTIILYIIFGIIYLQRITGAVSNSAENTPEA